MLRLLVTFAAATCALSAQLNDVFEWKNMTYEWKSQEQKENFLKGQQYIVENNLPLGVDRWKDKLFVTIPRYVEVS